MVYTMKSLIFSMKSRFRTKRVAWNLTEWHLLGGGGGGRRGKDVCNHDVHFCRKASLPDKCNALQTWPRWDRLTEMFTYSKDEVCNDLPSVSDADAAHPKGGNRRVQLKWIFNLSFNANTTLCCVCGGASWTVTMIVWLSPPLARLTWSITWFGDD